MSTAWSNTPAPVAKILPLVSGDQLTRDEFERRYEAMPHVNKAELLEGVVHIPPPVHWNGHTDPRVHLVGWLGMYRAYSPGVEVGYKPTLRLDPVNEPQPDAAMIIEPEHGGNVQLDKDGYLEGAPELVAEVASSSVNIDMNKKLRVYRNNEVREYVVWRVLDQEIDWFVLRNTEYERLPIGDDGYYKSEVFPGLWLDAPALIRLDLATVLKVLQIGLDSSEHAAFVAKLQQAAQDQ